MINSRCLQIDMAVSRVPLRIIAAKKVQIEGQSMLKHKAAESLLDEENYEGLQGDRGMVEHNH